MLSLNQPISNVKANLVGFSLLTLLPNIARPSQQRLASEAQGRVSLLYHL
ncbi:hypothetical protein SAMN05421823_1185 [Catalinimonas alkaloidigena]|uniref:Uncharacterized protein n=1 Tax=Catalinimonas alkaloidigena TaxID=1075417 RepID=A0A1G9UVB3_9BACT|nr:hypothetical protein SAMN05421823_1185 [Catalinimonas alkaloidigena]